MNDFKRLVINPEVTHSFDTKFNDHLQFGIKNISKSVLYDVNLFLNPGESLSTTTHNRANSKFPQRYLHAFWNESVSMHEVLLSCEEGVFKFLHCVAARHPYPFNFAFLLFPLNHIQIIIYKISTLENKFFLFLHFSRLKIFFAYQVIKHFRLFS